MPPTDLARPTADRREFTPPMDIESNPTEPAVPPVPRAGFGLRLDPQGRHVFCGAHDIAGAGCPNCDRPLMQMMSLDASDERLELTELGVARVPLLFCWKCNIAQGITQYRLRRDGGIELLVFLRGTQGPNFPYSDYPHSFPEARFELIPVPAEPATDPRHQVGGMPFVSQMLHDTRCTICWRSMRFLACIADDATRGWSFAGNYWVQTIFHVCLEDGVIASYHECE
jgi:hypothetical protein